MAEVGLRLHPDKTKIVYCKSEKRRADYAHTSFTFLGYTFAPRPVLGKDERRSSGSCLRSAGTPSPRWTPGPSMATAPVDWTKSGRACQGVESDCGGLDQLL